MRTYKIIFPVILILFFIISNTNAGGLLDGDGISNLDKKRWNMFIEKIKCKLTANIKYVDLKKEKFPVIQVELKYRGSENYSLQWDKEFARVLWNGDFILVSKSGSHKEDTSEMKYRTSNTYEPGESILLKKGSSISSILDFTKMPGTFAGSLLNRRGLVALRLYVKAKGRDDKLIAVSNKLLIKVK